MNFVICSYRLFDNLPYGENLILDYSVFPKTTLTLRFIAESILSLSLFLTFKQILLYPLLYGSDVIPVYGMMSCNYHL